MISDGVLTHCDRLPSRELMIEVASAFACLHINGNQTPFALSTKIYEYACSRRPTLSLNFGGEIEDLIEAHRLGISVRGDDSVAIRAALVEISNSWRSNPEFALNATDVEGFGYACLAMEWDGVLSDSIDGSLL